MRRWNHYAQPEIFRSGISKVARGSAMSYCLVHRAVYTLLISENAAPVTIFLLYCFGFWTLLSFPGLSYTTFNVARKCGIIGQASNIFLELQSMSHLLDWSRQYQFINMTQGVLHVACWCGVFFLVGCMKSPLYQICFGQDTDSCPFGENQLRWFASRLLCS